MNKRINRFLQGGTLVIGLLGATLSHADLGSMSKVYNNPQLAPQIQRCKGNTQCNAFYALAKDWQSIPNNFKLEGVNVKSYAKDGDGYGLWKGFTLNSNRAIALANAGDAVFFKGGDSSKADERIYAQGLAVLLYLDNQPVQPTVKSSSSNQVTVVVKTIEGYGDSSDAYTFKAMSGKRYMVYNAGGSAPVKGEALLNQSAKTKQAICLKLHAGSGTVGEVASISQGQCK